MLSLNNKYILFECYFLKRQKNLIQCKTVKRSDIHLGTDGEGKFLNQGFSHSHCDYWFEQIFPLSQIFSSSCQFMWLKCSLIYFSSSSLPGLFQAIWSPLGIKLFVYQRINQGTQAHVSTLLLIFVHLPVFMTQTDKRTFLAESINDLALQLGFYLYTHHHHHRVLLIGFNSSFLSRRMQSKTDWMANGWSEVDRQ